MRIQSVTLYHVDIPMRFAFRTAKETLKHRESMKVDKQDMEKWFLLQAHFIQWKL